MLKVLFLINSLGGGGAEKVLVNLVNNMDQTKYDITLQVIFKGGVNRAALAPGIHFVENGTPFFKGISRLFKLIPARLLYKYYIRDRYDVVVAYMHGLPTKILQCAPAGTASLAWLHTDMRQSSLPKFFTRGQIAHAFGRFDRIVGVGKSVSQSFIEEYGLEEKVVTRYNTNDVPGILKLSSTSVPLLGTGHASAKILRMITLGRFTAEKGYSRLLDCCCRLREDGFAFTLLILGRGPLESMLRKQCHDLGLDGIVTFGGYQTNPYPYIRQSGLLVCSSIQEGLNTAMSEALILGVPVISTRVSGAVEVLGEDSEYGLLVENSGEALYHGLKRLMSTPGLLEHYKTKAAERAHFFDTHATVKAVEELIDEVARCRS